MEREQKQVRRLDRRYNLPILYNGKSAEIALSLNDMGSSQRLPRGVDKVALISFSVVTSIGSSETMV